MGIQETWKAMSDPTRREILRLLRDKPLTAGEKFCTKKSI